MRSSKFKKWLYFLLGLTAIGFVMMLSSLLYPCNVQERVRYRNIDAGALFYSESPQALESAFKIQKLTGKRKH